MNEDIHSNGRMLASTRVTRRSP